MSSPCTYTSVTSSARCVIALARESSPPLKKHAVPGPRGGTLRLVGRRDDVDGDASEHRGETAPSSLWRAQVSKMSWIVVIEWTEPR